MLNQFLLKIRETKTNYYKNKGFDVNEIRPYKTREQGATATIFVPYDCNNHCPFCINKIEYADTSNFSIDKIIESIKIIDKITPKCDFVFTGGEPFANVKSLQLMIDNIPKTHKIFINTTFPVQPNVTDEEIFNFTEKNCDKITCINISRHLDGYVEESPDDFISRICSHKRINCVLFKNYHKEKLISYVERFYKYNIPIQFRFDYTDTTPENLYRIDDDNIYKNLCEEFIYTGLQGSRMRNSFYFKYKNNFLITYHKTLPYSTIIETDENNITYDILYDILIKQTGEIHSDWDGTKLDIERYKNVVFEKDDNKFLEKNSNFNY